LNDYIFIKLNINGKRERCKKRMGSQKIFSWGIYGEGRPHPGPLPQEREKTDQSLLPQDRGKPINPFSCRTGENRSIPSPAGQEKTDQSLLPQDRGKPINPFSLREKVRMRVVLKIMGVRQTQ
jgi:hypothetical protein